MSIPEIRSFTAHNPRSIATPANTAGFLPTTYSFLFTDIEGSTRLWEAQPETMRLALTQHDRILRQVIAENGGTVVKTTGDGFHAVFGTASDAVAAARSAQHALHTAKWIGDSPLRVRMGVHTGVADYREGDYYGAELNRAARLMAVGHGGQILLSEATQALARKDLSPNVTLRDLGTHRLKDLIQPEHIYQLVTSDLPTDFPPLKSLEGRPHNLPTYPTSMIGREADRVALVGLVRRGARLISLIGPGGIGKTRLGVQLGAELFDKADDGVFFVALDTVTDPSLVPSAIATSLNIPEMGLADTLSSLKFALRDKRMVLVLDNFEQVVAAAPHLAAMLEAAPHLVIVVTSRTALQVYGEHVYEVLPLALPDPAHSPSVSHLMAIPAIALFVQRARMVKPSFDLTTDNAAAISTICARLDGIPLALELAATRIRIFSPQALLERLNKRLALLTHGAQDKPQRHQTLRATIDWSYALLDTAEQQLFRRLAVFVGGAPLDAIVAICGDGDESVCDNLEQLASKSLVRLSDVQAETHISMFETLREYALEKLAESGEEAMLRQRHADYWLNRIVDIATRGAPARSLEVINALAQYYDNTRAAFGWCCDNGAYDRLLKVCKYISPMWYLRGMYHEGLGWLDNISAHTTHTDDKQNRIYMLRSFGLLLAELGEFKRAAVYESEAVELCRQITDTPLLITMLLSLGLSFNYLGQVDEGLRILEEGKNLAEESGDLTMVAFLHMNMGGTFLLIGQREQARSHINKAIGIARTLHADEPLAVATMILGWIEINEGAYDRAATALAQTLDVCERIQFVRQIGKVQNCYSYLYLAQKNTDDARKYAQPALANTTRIGDRYTLAACLVADAAIAQAKGDTDNAVRLLSASTAISTAMGSSQHYGTQFFYDRLLADLQSEMREERWQRLWQDGQAMTDAQAIALAQQVVTMPLREAPTSLTAL